MSDNTNVPNPAVPNAAPVDGKQPVAANEPSLDMANLSTAEAVALVNEAKAKGISVEELYKAKNGKVSVPQAAAPKDQSNESAIKEAAQEAKRKLKIGDEEVDEDEVLNVYKSRKDHQRAANKELQEGKAARKQAEEFLNLMKDPERFWEVAEKLGHKNRELAERLLVRQLEDEMMDPREKELRDAKAKLKSIEDMENKQKAAVEAKRVEEMKQKFVKDYESQFIDALKATDVPQTKATIAEMAKYISKSAKIGFKMTPKEAAQLVREDIQRAQMNLIGNSDGETLLKLLGDDVAKKILQARGAKVKQTNYNTPTEQGERREIQRSGDGKQMSHKEWREFNRPKKK